MNVWAQYVGLPFVALGRDLGGFDCIGFFAFVQLEHFGIVVPEAGVSPLNALAVRGAFKNHADVDDDWSVVAAPLEGDAVMMGTGRAVSHIGIYVETITGGGVLHCDDGIGGRGGGVIFTPLGEMNMADCGRQIIRFLRHKTRFD